MNTAQPIRKGEDLQRFKEYFQSKSPNKRNYLLVITGLNTALRISDILNLRWGDVYDFKRQRYREHLDILEQKTDKASLVFINRNMKKALMDYKDDIEKKQGRISPDQFLFESSSHKGRPISRVQAFRIIKEDADACNLEGVISCHSLRKTFGYHAWRQGIMPALLMNIYNHSSFQVTVRYLGIEQDDRDNIFKNINI